MITNLELKVYIFFVYTLGSVLGQNSCSKTASPWYYCDDTGLYQKNCNTFAILRANSHYSSLSNLSTHFSINPNDLAEANSFPSNTGLFSNGQPLLIPIYCSCNNNGFFEAGLSKTTIKGEGFTEIAEFLKGLTTCEAIKAKNPKIPPFNLDEKINLLVPVKCACPSSVELRKLYLLSYPVKEGDTLTGLAMEFNVTFETIVSANHKYSRRAGFKVNNGLQPFSTILIPIENKPVFGFSKNIQASSFRYPPRTTRVKRRKNPKKKGTFEAIAIIVLVACIVIGKICFFVMYKKSKKQESIKNEDSELSLSLRDTSDNKLSSEGSQYTSKDSIFDKTLLENYSFEELQKATDDFSISNLIESSKYHTRLKGRDLAIKRVSSDIISRIDFSLFHEKIHHHPNIISLLGTCVVDGPDSFVVLEYAKNGSLKDWIFKGLALKSQFISSCNCFLTWNQRLKICLQIAIALQYMHLTINPCYVHKNIRSRNIFLDDEFNAKVGNFGMCNCVEHENQEDKGYLAPECITQGTISPAIDVFAYGVVLLEVLSGKSAIRRDDDKGDGKFMIKLCDEIKHNILLLEDEERLSGWMDGSLGENYSFDQALMLANLAKACVDDDPLLRPNVGEIVEKLLNLVE